MIAAIILAAGESTRMGRPKPLLPWDGLTLLAWQVEQMRAAGVEDVVVVLGHEADAVGYALPAGARAVVNEAYREGRASSLRAGASALAPQTEAALILAIDQPRPAWISRALLEEWRQTCAPVALPAHVGRRGHPALIGQALIPELRQASEAEMGLRGILARHGDETMVVDVTSYVVNVDVNTPAEYEAALAAFRAGDWKRDNA